MTQWVRCAMLTVLVSAAVAVRAEDRLLIRPVPQTDPLEYGSLRLDDADAAATEPGWSATFTTTYFNQWNDTWHFRQTREDHGVKRDPVSAAEIHRIETVWAGEDDMYLLDVEGAKGELAVTRTSASGVSLSLRVPWIAIGTMAWDAIGERAHHVLPARRDREFFPRNATLVYLSSRTNGRVLRAEELDGSGAGDATLSLALPVGRHHRAAIAVQAPTGRADGLHGSGGWDTAALWLSSWETPRWAATLSAGFSMLDDRGDLLGVERDNTWSTTSSISRRLTEKTTARVVARLESSPLASFTDEKVGDPSLMYTLGVSRSFGDHWVAVDIGEELLPQSGVDADYSLHISFGSRFGRR